MNSFERFCGIEVIPSHQIPEFVPKLQLSLKVDVTDAFRAQCNALYLHLFGVKPAVYMFQGRLLMNPANLEKLKRAQRASALSVPAAEPMVRHTLSSLTDLYNFEC